MQFTAHYSSSSGNLYTLVSSDETLLIECGVPIKAIREALDYRLSDVSGCLVTHSHQDHAKAVNELTRMGIGCYMTRETAQAIGANGHNTHIIEPLKRFRAGRFNAIAFPTQHDCGGSVGFVISDGNSKLLFATDTFYIKYRFSGISIFAVECNWSKATIDPNIDHAVKRRLMLSHFSLEHVLEFFRAQDLSRCVEIHLLHLSDANSDAEYFKRELAKVTGKLVFVAGAL